MELKAWKWWLNWGKVARQSNTDTLDLTYPAWRLVAEPRNGWNFFNLVLCHMVSMFNHVSPRMQPNKTEVSAELIRFPSSLWTPWVFHTIVVCDCVEPSWDHESFVYLIACHSQKTSHSLWFLRIKLTFGAANCHYPELLPHDAHLTWKISSKHDAIFSPKNVVHSALRQSASPMWRDLNQSCVWKIIVFQTNWQRKLLLWKKKTTQVSNLKAANHVARRVNSLCLFFLAPKRNPSQSLLVGPKVMQHLSSYRSAVFLSCSHSPKIPNKI